MAHCLNAGGTGRIGYETETMVVHGEPLLAFNSNARPDEMKFDEPVSAPLTCSQNSAIAIHPHCIGRKPEAGPQGKEYLEDGSAYTMDSRGQAQAVCITGERTHALRAEGFDAGEDGTGRGHPIVNAAGPLYYSHDYCQDRIYGVGGVSEALTCTRRPNFMTGMQVRRLTPRECEKLQGFPPDYTAIPGAADGPRYKALGNSMAVPVMNWIGRQIDFVWRWF